MKQWARRIRAAVGMGLTWAVAWSGAGFVLARVPGFHADVPFAILFAPLGFLTGLAFSGILVAVARRGRMRHLSLARFAGWGAAGGLVLAGTIVAAAALRGEPWWPEFLLFAPPLTVGSAVCAAGSLALARRAERKALHGADVDSLAVARGDGVARELTGRAD